MTKHEQETNTTKKYMNKLRYENIKMTEEIQSILNTVNMLYPSVAELSVSDFRIEQA